MSPDAIRRFFDDYAAAAASLDLAFFASAYAESFLFAGPSGTQTVRLDDFLRMLPKRKEFFAAVGLTSSAIESLEENRLDDHYVMVKVRWRMRFEKHDKGPMFDDTAATYVLRREEHSMRIVFQLDHQDLAQRVRDLGLLPAAT
jgi:ketosteroid isomerase-like protein